MGGLRIFDTDPDAKPAPKPEKTEYTPADFSLRTGMQVFNDAKKKFEPLSLHAWRFTGDNEEVMKGLAELYGGEAEEFDPTKKENWHVLSTAEELLVVINGSKAVEDKLVQWGGQGGPLHECDGVVSLLEDDKGEPCGCPPTMKERKERASKGRGPKPSINVTFTLAGLGEELGKGKLIATAWTLAEVIHEVKDALDAVDGPALCKLRLELVEYTSKTYGPVSYRKPVIEVLGSYNDAIAEEQ